MTDNRHTFLAAALGFALTSAVMLPPVFEQRAKAAAREQAGPAEPTVELEEDVPARFSQMLRQQRG